MKQIIPLLSMFSAIAVGGYSFCWAADLLAENEKLVCNKVWFTDQMACHSGTLTTKPPQGGFWLLCPVIPLLSPVPVDNQYVVFLLFASTTRCCVSCMDVGRCPQF